MTKQWQDDDRLLDSASAHLLGAVSVFPKRMLRVDELIHRFDMPLSQMQILALVGEKTLNIGQISSRMGIAKPNITPLVDALIARGYVHRVRSGSDRRVVQVEIRPEGRACLNEIRLAITEQMRRWPAAATRADIEALDRSLETLLHFMDKIDEES